MHFLGAASRAIACGANPNFAARFSAWDQVSTFQLNAAALSAQYGEIGESNRRSPEFQCEEDSHYPRCDDNSLPGLSDHRWRHQPDLIG
jgi:hypothetical protein